MYYDLIGQALCMFCRWMGAILNYMTSVANNTRIPFVLRETIHRFVSFHMLSFNVGMYPEAGIFPDSYGSRIMRTKSGYSSRLNTLRCVPTGWFQKNFLNSKCILVVTASHRLRGKYCQFPAVLPPMIYGSLMTRPMLARFHYRQILLIFLSRINLNYVLVSTKSINCLWRLIRLCKYVFIMDFKRYP